MISRIAVIFGISQLYYIGAEGVKVPPQRSSKGGGDDDLPPPNNKLCSIIRRTLLLVLRYREPPGRPRGWKYRCLGIRWMSVSSYNAEVVLCLEIWFLSVISRMHFKVAVISLTFHPLHDSLIISDKQSPDLFAENQAVRTDGKTTRAPLWIAPNPKSEVAATRGSATIPWTPRSPDQRLRMAKVDWRHDRTDMTARARTTIPVTPRQTIDETRVARSVNSRRSGKDFPLNCAVLSSDSGGACECVSEAYTAHSWHPDQPRHVMPNVIQALLEA